MATEEVLGSLENATDTTQFDFLFNPLNKNDNYVYPYVNWNYDWRNGFQIKECGDKRGAPWWEDRLVIYPSYEQMETDDPTEYRDRVTPILQNAKWEDDYGWVNDYDWYPDIWVLDCFSAPLYCEVQSWLRDKGYDVIPYRKNNNGYYSSKYTVKIICNEFGGLKDCSIQLPENFNTYEEALEYGINDILKEI